MTDKRCSHCGGEGWVCENHLDKAWPDQCDCGAGCNCSCNPTGEAPEGFVTVATSGWERECGYTDALLTALGLDPERCRTEGGTLQIGKIISMLTLSPPAQVGTSGASAEVSRLAEEAKRALHDYRLRADGDSSADAYVAVELTIDALATMSSPAAKAGTEDADAQATPRFPFAGIDPKFCPGSNPENPQDEHDDWAPGNPFGDLISAVIDWYESTGVGANAEAAKIVEQRFASITAPQLAPAAPVAAVWKPVAEVVTRTTCDGHGFRALQFFSEFENLRHGTLLYAAPPARSPLTKAQTLYLAAQVDLARDYNNDGEVQSTRREGADITDQVLAFTEAIEAAHRILAAGSMEAK